MLNIEEINQRIIEMQAEINTWERRMELERHLMRSEILNPLSSKFDNLSNKIDKLDTKVDKVSTEFTTKIDKISSDLISLTVKVDERQKWVDKVWQIGISLFLTVFSISVTVTTHRLGWWN